MKVLLSLFLLSTLVACSGSKSTNDVEGEDAGVEMIDAFALNNQEVLEKLVKIQSMKPSKTHHHPWFGEFSAKQWLCLMAVHMKLHRKQIEKILDCSNKI
mgnify:CR=1 FL=1